MEGSGRQFRAITLIEVIGMLLIIAIVMAIAMPIIANYRYQHEKDREHAAIQDLANIRRVLLYYYKQNNRYPTTAEGLNSMVTEPKSLSGGWGSGAVEKIPDDPWGRPYKYRCPGSDGADYDLFCTGQSGRVGNADNIK